ncbi:MAG: 1-acyl-sn-glycerol-3-phosphate acyltransferase [Salinarimonas sp.]|nr:1-acyl-sn-glycerol-3-phosphate acyltransferase [Salinarimonas sp.]
MLILRSLAFNLAYYLNLFVWMVLCLPVLALPRRVFMRVARAWARSSLWLLKMIAGTEVDFRGLEKIPAGGMIVASKHQSLWETFALLVILDDPAYVLKRELMWIPFFGWYAWKARSVPVDRKGGSQALKEMNARARAEIAAGRQIIIFPEGTRRQPGAPPAYKFGVAHLYAKLGAPCLPVALNSGMYWPRRRFIRHPGTIVVDVLDPIAPGMTRDVFFAELQSRIEGATNALLEEARTPRD